MDRGVPDARQGPKITSLVMSVSTFSVVVTADPEVEDTTGISSADLLTATLVRVLRYGLDAVKERDSVEPGGTMEAGRARDDEYVAFTAWDDERAEVK